MAWNSYIGTFGCSSGAQISCSGACSSSSRACISSSGQRLQSLEAPEALSFSRGLAFSPSGATTLPHINYAWGGCFSFINYNSEIMSTCSAIPWSFATSFKVKVVTTVTIMIDLLASIIKCTTKWSPLCPTCRQPCAPPPLCKGPQ